MTSEDQNMALSQKCASIDLILIQFLSRSTPRQHRTNADYKDYNDYKFNTRPRRSLERCLNITKLNVCRDPLNLKSRKRKGTIHTTCWLVRLNVDGHQGHVYVLQTSAGI